MHWCLEPGEEVQEEFDKLMLDMQMFSLSTSTPAGQLNHLLPAEPCAIIRNFLLEDVQSMRVANGLVTMNTAL